MIFLQQLFIQSVHSTCNQRTLIVKLLVNFMEIPTSPDFNATKPLKNYNKCAINSFKFLNMKESFWIFLTCCSLASVQASHSRCIPGNVVGFFLSRTILTYKNQLKLLQSFIVDLLFIFNYKDIWHKLQKKKQHILLSMHQGCFRISRTFLSANQSETSYPAAQNLVEFLTCK